jgi:phosphotransferase system  glucose/maltose/N-acetylglucosamine-specific IIC component
MSARKTVQGLIAGLAISLALAPTALAGPAGDEYLPKVPQAGGSASAHSASGGSGETTLPQANKKGSQDTTGNGKGKGKKKDDAANAAVPAGGSGSGGGGDDSSGSILLNPIVLLMIAAVIAAAVGMILRRRQLGDDEGDPESKQGPGAPASGSPRTPDGEIIAGQDKAA